MIDLGALTLGPGIAAFGQPVTYAPQGGAAFAIAGIFDRHAASISFGEDGVPTSVRRPQLGLRLADFPAGTVPRQYDSVTVAGAAFQVVDLQPDGLGGITLVLGNRSTADDDGP